MSVPSQPCHRSALFLTALFAAAWLAEIASAATTFHLAPIDLGSGFLINGVVQTDGTVGLLNSGNITGWSLTLTSITDFTYTPANVINISTGLASDGQQIFVATSPDGADDGGSLAFRAPSPWSDVGLAVADFTGMNTTGGAASYSTGIAFDTLPLGQPNGVAFAAAHVRSGSTTLFDLKPVRFRGNVGLSGTLETDGNVGNAVLTNWNLLLRQTERWTYTSANSRLLDAVNVVSDGRRLKITPDDGQGNLGLLAFGVPGMEPTAVTLADFTYDPNGEAGYISPLMSFSTGPLSLGSDGTYIVGTAPDGGSTVGLCLAGIAVLIGLAARRPPRPLSRV